MDLLEVLALGAALGADSLSVSIGIGMGGVSLLRAIKLAGLFGGMQGVLLASGAGLAAWLHWLLDTLATSGGFLGRLVCGLDVVCVHGCIHAGLSIAGAAILCLVGVNLIRGYMSRKDGERPVYYRGRFTLLLLALSVSMDALSAGVGLGMFEGYALTTVCVLVALVIFLMAMAGLRTGRRIGALIGRRAEPVGGCLLILLALHLLSQIA